MSTPSRILPSPDHVRIMGAALDTWHGKPANLTPDEWELAEALLEGSDDMLAELERVEKQAA